MYKNSVADLDPTEHARREVGHRSRWASRWSTFAAALPGRFVEVGSHMFVAHDFGDVLGCR